MVDAKRQHQSGQPSYRVIRDPVYDYVELPEALDVLLDHPMVQRLRRVSQTAMAASVFPSLTGSRFEHSLGTMHLALHAWRSVWSRTNPESQASFRQAVHDDLMSEVDDLDDATSDWVTADSGVFDRDFTHKIGVSIAAAGLLHDVGHPPFSHTLEGFFDRNIASIILGLTPNVEEFARSLKHDPSRPFHERVGHQVTNQISAELARDGNNSIPWAIVRRVLKPRGDLTWDDALAQIVASEVDTDRIDYLVRDAMNAGTQFGSFDTRRLMESLEFHHKTVPGPEGKAVSQWRIGYGYRARTAIESLLTNRLRYYQWVLFHPHVAAANKFMDLCLQHALDFAHLASNTNLPFSEQAVAARFAALKPDLNYLELTSHESISIQIPTKVVKKPESVRDTANDRLQADVDDHVITTWQKQVASAARAAKRSTLVSTPFKDRLNRYLALHDAVVHRAPNWVTAWKTEDQFVSSAEKMMPSILKNLEDLRSEVSRRVTERLDSDQSEKGKDIFAVAHSALTQIIVAGKTEPSSALNLIADYLLGSKSTAVRLTNERRAAEALDINTVGDLEGFVVFAYDKVSPSRNDEKSLRVWTGNVSVPLHQKNPMVAALPAIAEKFPRFYAYFVSTSKISIRTGRNSQYSGSFKARLEEALPSVIGALLLEKVSLGAM